jgi:hypothetical protein
MSQTEGVQEYSKACDGCAVDDSSKIKGFEYIG